ncbi:phage tail protein [Magnetospirillum gryphiswaldense]|uniref:Phage tail collar domain-containing protein n=2 Tax=Magnetospirillum gryphiswaldense TaxID=55518 RepID=V6F2K4_MAGGM|nr:tail fiber protein [Magnetospirillum gryphiswaldense]AVM73465.1 Phage Tail Collar Domain protein [Magnetospirillum gryphiswaldense MSR-1]AVM77368.1 Phage Tail Collar Domain protein [Magnetospirillum gryphiswaldense]CAM77676.1 microcystin dependent protein [Magnetospirillum gryphiswaldense MSR-1]CDK98516.1 conserved protein of unknown function [Magnetospirillum gryphiswaldense MSR-1 v2]
MNRKKTRISLAAATLALGTGVSMFSAPAYACGEDTYLGSICAVAAKYCPSGFLPAQGQLLSTSQNQALYYLLGNTYGGDGQTTFALPDLRGRTVTGVGSGPGLTPVPLGQRRGQEGVTLTPAQVPTANGPLSSGNQAATQTVPTLPPQLGLTYCISTGGLFPPQP